MKPPIGSLVVVRPDAAQGLVKALALLKHPPVGTPATVVSWGRLIVNIRYEGRDGIFSIHPTHLELYQEEIIT